MIFLSIPVSITTGGGGGGGLMFQNTHSSWFAFLNDVLDFSQNSHEGFLAIVLAILEGENSNFMARRPQLW